MAETLTSWQTAADQVLAVLLRDGAGYQKARFEWTLAEHHFPPGPRRALFAAVDRARQEQREVTLTTVHDLGESAVTLDFIGERWMLYSPAMGGEALAANVDILKTRSQVAQQIAVLDRGKEALAKAETPQERAAVTGMIITQLDTHGDLAMADPSSAAAGARFEALMDSDNHQGQTVGIPWIDGLTGGILSEEIWWIAAAYKMRKSSMMRNIALNVARAGGNVTICTFEGSQTLLIAQFVAMLAAEHLIEKQLFGWNDGHGQPLNAISARHLLMLRNEYKTKLDPRQVEAVSEGIKAYKALGKHLRIYDNTPANGRLSDLASIQTVVRRDKHLYGCDLLCVDYLQRISGRGSYFERISGHALDLQGMALHHHLALLVLAQRNEEAVKGHGDDYSPSVKGGGDPAATADFMFMTTYPYKSDSGSEDKARVGIECRLSRHSEGGGKTSLAIHPASGLLVPDGQMAAPLDLGTKDDAR